MKSKMKTCSTCKRKLTPAIVDIVKGKPRGMCRLCRRAYQNKRYNPAKRRAAYEASRSALDPARIVGKDESRPEGTRINTTRRTHEST